ncbi:hypothetical protein DEM27_11575 [Metarhizobium album]|uniref:Uncharacterized protein n=1 Tax=Metarhizobium album TaxID=2182425 RepID=A0A2U2DS12_9HYPH|nr:DUF4148 domain-containing protein [Rhizobium album]OJU01078.1 MAG: hypothetical protein BGN83_07195 [Rhizobium sp. 63-7]PWE56071.1 hypothetical protein DEM27_11575 [Rhizobium album]
MKTTYSVRRLLSAAAGVAVLSSALLGFASSASAADVTFVMRNSHPNAVEVELYSQDRSHVWPGDNQVYYLDDGESKTMSLACNEGEKICYGAWVSGDKSTYWGTGPDNAETCTDCCYTCTGGETEEINLVP